MQQFSIYSWQHMLLGHYRLRQKLGQGSMGEIWLGEDTHTHEQVALKLLAVTSEKETGYLEAFEREAERLTQLNQEHILPVQAYGKQQIDEQDIVTYLVMPYIAGKNLQAYLLEKGETLPPQETFMYLQQAAHAIDFAHRQQIIHGNLKPVNILLQQEWLFLTDFGLINILKRMPDQSRTNAGAGSAEYMAPEQAQGNALPASDIYSLAVIAYQLFTGQVPFKGETLYATLMKQIRENPIPPQYLQTSIPEQAGQAILQGLAKRPEERPTSCTALVQAIEQGWQLGKLATIDPDATVLAPWSKRRIENQKTTLYSETPNEAAAFTDFETGSGFPVTEMPTRLPQTPFPNTDYGSSSPSLPHIPESPVPTHSPQAQPDKRVHPVQASKAGKISRRTALITGGTLAAIAALGGTGIYYWYSKTPQTQPSPVIPGPQKLTIGTPVFNLTAHDKGVECVQWDPTGRYLLTGSDDTRIMLWDIGSALQKHRNGFQTLSTPLRKWKLSNDDFFEMERDSFRWSADGRSFIARPGNDQIYVYDAFDKTNTPQIYQIPPSDSINKPTYDLLTVSPRSGYFATHDLNTQPQAPQILLWQIGHTQKPIQKFVSTNPKPADAQPYGPDVLSWSLDGKWIAAHTEYSSVLIWNAQTGKLKQEIKLPVRQVPDNEIINNEYLAWSPTNPNLLAISDIDVAVIWDIQKNKQLLTLKLNEPLLNEPGHIPYIWSMSWSPNGKYIAMCYPRSPRVYIWDVETGGVSARLGIERTQKLFFPPLHAPGHKAAVTTLAWSPDGTYIATASGDATVIIWKVDAA